MSEPETTPGRIWVNVLEAREAEGATVIARWRKAMTEAGHPPHEEPKIAWDGVRMNPLTGEVLVAVVGQVTVPPMPLFEPTPVTVALAARRVAVEIAPGFEWDDLPVALQDMYSHVARQIIGAAGQGLIADAASHVGKHPQAYKVTSHADCFIDLSESVRDRIERKKA